MLDDDFLKQLHHVLLEVSQYAVFPFSLTSFVDPRRRRFDDMPKLRARVSHFKRDPKYGPRLHSSNVTTSHVLSHSPFTVVGGV